MAENREEFVKFFQSLAPEKREELRKSYEEYGFGDLAKDLAKGWYKWRKEQKSWGEMSEDEKLEFASQFADVPGVLKPMALAKLMKTPLLFKGEPRITPAQVKHFTEVLKVPFEEFRRIKDIDWAGLPLASGQYRRKGAKILLNLEEHLPLTAQHEFTHARQWLPEKEISEVTLTNYMKLLRNELWAQQALRHSTDPTEIHATGVEAFLKRGESFGEAFRNAMNLPLVFRKAESLVGTRKARDLWALATNFGSKLELKGD